MCCEAIYGGLPIKPGVGASGEENCYWSYTYNWGVEVKTHNIFLSTTGNANQRLCSSFVAGRMRRYSEDAALVRTRIVTTVLLHLA